MDETFIAPTMPMVAKDDTETEEDSESIPIDAQPVGYLRIMAQQELEQTDYPVYEGESSIGRSVDCDLSIETVSLSRKHAVILVEGGTHFVQDNDSRNKTYRGSVQLRPHAYYELTDGCELTFADIKCQYFLGPPPDMKEDGDEETYEQTQAYNLADGEESAIGGGGRSTTAEQCSSDGVCGVVKHDGATERFEDEEKEEEEMEYAPTLAYNLGDCEEEESSNTTRSSSPPLLANRHTPVVSPMGDSAAAKEQRQVKSLSASADTASAGYDDDTDVEEEAGSEGRGGTAAMDVEPTIAYKLDSDVEDEEGEEDGGGEKEKPDGKVRTGVKEKPMLKEDEKDANRKEDCKSKNAASDVAAAGTSSSHLTAAEKEETTNRTFQPNPAISVGADSNGATTKETDTCEPTVPCNDDDLSDTTVEDDENSISRDPPPSNVCEPTVPCNDSDEDEKVISEGPSTKVCEPAVPCADLEAMHGAESDSSFDTFLPLLTSKASTHSKQKTMFSLVADNQARGRGKRGERGRGRGRGRGKREKGQPGRVTRSRRGKKETTEDPELSEDSNIESKGEDSYDDKTTIEGSSIDENQFTPSEGDPVQTKDCSVQTKDDPKDKQVSTRASRLRTKTQKAASSMKVDQVPKSPSNNPPSKVTSPLSAHRANTSILEEQAIPSATSTRGQRSTTRGRQRGARRGRSSLTQPVEESGKLSDSMGTTDLTAFEDESPDITSVVSSRNSGDSQSHDSKSHDPGNQGDKEARNDSQPDQSSAMSISQSTVGKRGRGKRGQSLTGKRGKVTSSRGRSGRKTTNSKQSPIPAVGSKASPPSTPILRKSSITPTHTPSLPSATSKGHTSAPSDDTSCDKPKVMFTGVIDKAGEKIVKDLGGELVDSVYLCTHLITDKVRRTVKFLCCLSRGCVIVNESWLDDCSKAGHFLPVENYLIKDRIAERQHQFSLAKSLKVAKGELLSGYKVHLTPSLKPEREQMSDIIKCSGGEAVDFSPPIEPGDRVIIVSCDQDLSMCKEAMEAGVPVHSTELILGGVLRQALDLGSYLMTLASASAGSRKRKTRESNNSTLLSTSAKRKRK